MAQIGATLKAFKERFIKCLEEDEGIKHPGVLAAFDRALIDFLAETVDGVTAKPAEPAKPRKKRGPNKKKAGEDSGAQGTQS